MRRLSVSYVDPAMLSVRKGHARTHQPRQIKQIVASMEHFGFTQPLLVDADNVVIAGVGRLAAAKKLKMGTVPVIRLDQMSEADKRAYALADNKLAEEAGWDRELLKVEFAYLSDPALNFDIELTGFSMGEVDILLAPGDDRNLSDKPVDAKGPAVTRLGDLWTLGGHRLLCGDARDGAAYERLLGGEKAQMVIADPPYNLSLDAHLMRVSGGRHREFAMGRGEMKPAEFRSFLDSVARLLVVNSVPGSIHMIFMDWRHMGEMAELGDAIYTETKNVCVWVKSNAGMGKFYRAQHEFVFIFKAGDAPHINNFELGAKGRYRTNVWQYPGANGFGEGRGRGTSVHPTSKPVKLLAEAMLDCSNRGGLVLDPFCGSGSSLLAGEETGRVVAAIELDPLYVDAAIRRFQEVTGVSALLDGLTFDEVAAERASWKEAA